MTALSALAFLLIPLATRVSAGAFLVLIVIWSITSSALRAPPLKLLGRYTPPDQQPWVSSLFLLGTGITSAVAPFLAGWITTYDPRIMFAISSASVVVVTSSIVWAEKALAGSAPPEEHGKSKVHSGLFVMFLAAILLLSIGFQVHVFINGERIFANVGRPHDVSDLLSLFWIAFSLAMLPASALTKRFGGVAVVALGAFVGAGSAWATTQAHDAVVAGVAQFVLWGSLGVRDDERRRVSPGDRPTRQRRHSGRGDVLDNGGGGRGTYCADRRTLRARLAIDSSFVLGARPLLAGGGADGASGRSKAGAEKWALTWWMRPSRSVGFWYD